MDSLPFFVIAAFWLWWAWWENKEAERRRTRPERARRSTRRLEIDMLVAMGAEDYLRRILIGDLRAMHAQGQAREWIRENYKMEIEGWPLTTTTS